MSGRGRKVINNVGKSGRKWGKVGKNFLYLQTKTSKWQK